jgi:hypothetical protein
MRYTDRFAQAKPDYWFAQSAELAQVPGESAARGDGSRGGNRAWSATFW